MESDRYVRIRIAIVIDTMYKTRRAQLDKVLVISRHNPWASFQNSFEPLAILLNVPPKRILPLPRYPSTPSNLTPQIQLAFFLPTSFSPRGWPLSISSWSWHGLLGPFTEVIVFRYWRPSMPLGFSNSLEVSPEASPSNSFILRRPSYVSSE